MISETFLHVNNISYAIYRNILHCNIIGLSTQSIHQQSLLINKILITVIIAFTHNTHVDDTCNIMVENVIMDTQDDNNLCIYTHLGILITTNS